MNFFLTFPVLIISTIPEKKIAGYNYESRKKYIYATNLSYENSKTKCQDHMFNYFNCLYLEPTIKAYKEKLNQLPEFCNKIQPLHIHYVNLYKHAISNFLKSYSEKIFLFSKIDTNEFWKFTRDRISKMIIDEYKKFSLQKVNECYDYKPCNKDFLDIISKNRKRFDDVFYDLTRQFASDLAEYIGLELFELCKYFQLIVFTNKGTEDNELVPWDFIAEYDEFEARKFFEKISETVVECPPNTRIVLRFHIDPLFLVTNIFTSILYEMKSQNEHKNNELTESDIYVITEDRMYKYIYNILFDHLFGLRDILLVARQKGFNITILNYNVEYDIIDFITCYLKKIKSNNVVIKDINRCYFENKILILVNFFEKLSNIIVAACKYKSENLPISLLYENEFCKENAKPNYTIVEPEKAKKNLKRLYFLLIKYEKNLKDIYKDYKKIVHVLLKIISMVKVDNIPEKNDIKEKLMKNLSMSYSKIAQIHINFELFFFRLVFKFNMMVEKIHTNKDISSTEFSRFEKRICENITLLSKYFIIIKKQLNEKIFQIKYEEDIAGVEMVKNEELSCLIDEEQQEEDCNTEFLVSITELDEILKSYKKPLILTSVFFKRIFVDYDETKNSQKLPEFFLDEPLQQKNEILKTRSNANGNTETAEAIALPIEKEKSKKNKIETARKTKKK
ncbi:hypothetical protein EDEG_03754 [Edhazardia aedis USNM 41457]|uniref:Uncharacterized protein n=1 Tax=Edhazardia aedis (strain USNM 41457) TaxID=1003232 RepID=J9D1J6_EDHAE|nr:hypothetical protein EDEG_03754 [Edhazardia aedis USNM 41457]|eukprot:EJW01711.1 hypothetical protein EDEG_03754 [Edhazardia aedis USNM 41457]